MGLKVDLLCTKIGPNQGLTLPEERYGPECWQSGEQRNFTISRHAMKSEHGGNHVIMQQMGIRLLVGNWVTVSHWTR